MEKKKLGDTLKEIRLNQGLKQKEIYDNEFLPRTTYQKIENNERMPAYDRLLYIAKKLNTTVTEIEFLQYNKDLSEVNKLIFDFRVNLKNSMYKDKVKALKKRMEDFLEKEYDRNIFELIAILEAMLVIEETQEYQAPKQLVSFIWERLEKQDEWQLYDMMIIANIFFIFPVSTARNIIKRLMNQLETYKYFEQTRRMQLAINLNVVNYFRAEGLLLEAEKYIDTAIELAKEIENLTYEVIAKYRRAELLLIKGDVETAKEISADMLTILRLGDKQELFKELKKDWENISENIDKYVRT